MPADTALLQHEAGVLGVHVVGGRVYLALRTALGTLNDSPDLRRLDPSDYMDSAPALHNFCQRFQQLLRACRPERIAFLHTRNYRPNSYSDAFKRASVESAVMIAAAAEGIPYQLVRQEDVAARLSLSAHWRAKELADAATELSPGKPLYWAERSLAYAAALTTSTGKVGS